MTIRTSLLPVLLISLLSSSKALAFLGIGGSAGVGFWFNGRGGFTAIPQEPPNSGGGGGGSEYAALQAWKSAITEDPKGILASWAGPNVCSYRGVFCSDPPDGAPAASPTVVAGIDLNGANLKGSLVKELSFLTHLSFIHLNSNRFSGAVPDSLGELAYLTELDLSSNQFSGPFPASTLLIPSLVYLDLRFNSFSGEVPDALFRRDLDAIFLNNNQFEGQIPSSLWASPASVITLANNRFTGSIPTNFAYMGSGIREVLFLNNKLTGCIPEGIGYLDDIEVLDMSFNSLTGHLPGTLSCLSDIEVLNIGHNQLSGELSELVCNLKSLINLTVSFNFFDGFDQDCGRLFFRNVWFDISGNCIPGKDMQRPPPECMGIPGSDLSCFRMPSPRAFACAGAFRQGGVQPAIPYALSNSERSSPP